MTMKSHFELNTAFRVESFSVDALGLRHHCFKIDEDAHILNGQDVAHGLWFLAI